MKRIIIVGIGMVAIAGFQSIWYWHREDERNTYYKATRDDYDRDVYQQVIQRKADHAREIQAAADKQAAADLEREKAAADQIAVRKMQDLLDEESRIKTQRALNEELAASRLKLQLEESRSKNRNAD